MLCVLTTKVCRKSYSNLTIQSVANDCVVNNSQGRSLDLYKRNMKLVADELLACQNSYLLNTVLKNELGYQGFGKLLLPHETNGYD